MSRLVEAKESVPAWLQIVIGIGSALVVWKLFPIVEILNIFVVVVIVPVLFLGSFFLIGDGVRRQFQTAWNEIMERARGLLEPEPEQGQPTP